MIIVNIECSIVIDYIIIVNGSESICNVYIPIIFLDIYKDELRGNTFFWPWYSEFNVYRRRGRGGVVL